jgi:hypothetical protein
VREADTSSTVSRVSRKCGILNISQLYKFPRPAMGLALTFTFLIYCHNSEHYPMSCLVLRKRFEEFCLCLQVEPIQVAAIEKPVSAQAWRERERLSFSFGPT